MLYKRQKIMQIVLPCFNKQRAKTHVNWFQQSLITSSQIQQNKLRFKDAKLIIMQFVLQDVKCRTKAHANCTPKWWIKLKKTSNCTPKCWINGKNTSCKLYSNVLNELHSKVLNNKWHKLYCNVLNEGYYYLLKAPPIAQGHSTQGFWIEGKTKCKL